MRILILGIYFLYIFILIILHDPTSCRALIFTRAEIKAVCLSVCLSVCLEKVSGKGGLISIPNMRC